ncbi:TlpA disulfide reductase family protein [Ramlibacter sp. H39-3-26]|nr:TlpA disulfide reductase family protein [Ramlibacter sp. H39-3-26]MDF1484780.1 TlpA disulfide reductase family protein [Ramlibacter sp. H39-3-26]
MRRRAVFAGVAATALLAGAGAAWQALRRQAGDADAEALWGHGFETPEGGVLALQSLRGKPVLVNFWATWCPPCVEEMPLLERFFRENAGKGWQVVGIAADQREPVRKFLTRVPISYPIALAGFSGIELGKALGNAGGGLPFTVVLGKDGRLAGRKIGRLSLEDLQRWVAQI